MQVGRPDERQGAQRVAVESVGCASEMAETKAGSLSGSSTHVMASSSAAAMTSVSRSESLRRLQLTRCFSGSLPTVVHRLPPMRPVLLLLMLARLTLALVPAAALVSLTTVTASRGAS